MDSVADRISVCPRRAGPAAVLRVSSTTPYRRHTGPEPQRGGGGSGGDVGGVVRGYGNGPAVAPSHERRRARSLSKFSSEDVVPLRRCRTEQKESRGTVWNAPM